MEIQAKLMKAMVVTKYGPPEGLKLKEVEKPVHMGDEVLIRIHATTVTAGDVFLRRLRLSLKIVFGLFLISEKTKYWGMSFPGKLKRLAKT